MSIFLAVRKVIPATWLNDRDQFLFPNDGWQKDLEFQTDSLVYTLFNNNIQSKFGTNYWIPYTEEEVSAQEAFDSHFMSDYLHGRGDAALSVGYEAPTQNNNGAATLRAASPRIAPTEQSLFAAEPLAAKSPSLFGEGWGEAYPSENYVPLEHLSAEAKAVMEAGRKLWHYYHEQQNANPNASLYDIRLHFQGYKTTKSGKVQMNPDSTDPTYTALVAILRKTLKNLAAHIATKVYAHGFLLE